MAPYLILFIVATLFGLLSLDRRAPVGTLYLFLAVILICVVGFRYASTDYFSYLSIYERVQDPTKLGLVTYKLSPVTPIESGFAALILLEKHLVGSFAVFIFLIAAISLLVKFAAFQKMSLLPVVSVLLYLSNEYFLKDLSQIRNALASGIVLYAVSFVLDKRPFRFLCLVWIASVFHAAAILALPLHFARRFSGQLPMLSALVLGVILAYLGGVGIYAATGVASLMGFSDSARLIKYLDARYLGGIAPFGGTMLLHLFMSILFIGMKQKLVKANAYNNILIPMYVYGSAAMMAFIDYSIVNSRIRELFCISAGACIVPTIIVNIRGEYQKLIAYCFVIIFAAVLFFAFVRNVPPYRTILFA